MQTVRHITYTKHNTETNKAARINYSWEAHKSNVNNIHWSKREGKNVHEQSKVSEVYYFSKQLLEAIPHHCYNIINDIQWSKREDKNVHKKSKVSKVYYF